MTNNPSPTVDDELVALVRLQPAIAKLRTLKQLMNTCHQPFYEELIEEILTDILGGNAVKALSDSAEGED